MTEVDENFQAFQTIKKQQRQRPANALNADEFGGEFGELLQKKMDLKGSLDYDIHEELRNSGNNDFIPPELPLVENGSNQFQSFQQNSIPQLPVFGENPFPTFDNVNDNGNQFNPFNGNQFNGELPILPENGNATLNQSGLFPINNANVQPTFPVFDNTNQNQFGQFTNQSSINEIQVNNRNSLTDSQREQQRLQEFYALEAKRIVNRWVHAHDMNYPKRRQMEDAFATSDPLYEYNNEEHKVALYAVFDGHGGRFCALKSADIVAEIVKTKLKANHIDSTEYMKAYNEHRKIQQEAMKKQKNSQQVKLNPEVDKAQKKLDEEQKKYDEVFKKAMKEVCEAMDSILIDEKDDNSGCCALFCIIDIWGDNCLVSMANVGDTCGYIYEQNDHGHITGCVEMSVEHRPTFMNQEEVDRINGMGGIIFNERINGVIAVSRALGDDGLKPYLSNEPYCRSYMCDRKNNRYIVMGCDGLWDYVSPFQAGELLEKYLKDPSMKFDDFSRAFINQSKFNRSSDNISVIVIDVAPKGTQ